MRFKKLLCLGLSFSLVCCTFVVDAKSKPKLKNKVLNLKVGGSSKIKVLNYKVKKQSYKVVNKGVVKVSKKGKVTALKVGNTKIRCTFTLKGRKKKYKVTVKAIVRASGGSSISNTPSPTKEPIITPTPTPEVEIKNPFVDTDEICRPTRTPSSDTESGDNTDETQRPTSVPSSSADTKPSTDTKPSSSPDVKYEDTLYNTGVGNYPLWLMDSSQYTYELYGVGDKTTIIGLTSTDTCLILRSTTQPYQYIGLSSQGITGEVYTPVGNLIKFYGSTSFSIDAEEVYDSGTMYLRPFYDVLDTHSEPYIFISMLVGSNLNNVVCINECAELQQYGSGFKITGRYSEYISDGKIIFK